MYMEKAKASNRLIDLFHLVPLNYISVEGEPTVGTISLTTEKPKKYYVLEQIV